jgi:hypothetical protein
MLGNTNVVGFQSIEYSEKVAKSNTYGALSNPVERVSGKREFSASISLTLADVRLMQAIAGGKSLTEFAPFELAITFNNLEDTITTDILHYCEFTEDTISASVSSDDGIVVSLPLIIGGITRSI